MDTTASAPQRQHRRTLDPLRHHTHYQNGENGSPYAGGSSFMERMSEKVASGMGTVPFIVISVILILAWVFANGAASYIHSTVHNIENGNQFDPEPWILLNLVFSAVAFFTGAPWSTNAAGGLDQLEFRGDVDCAFQAASDWAQAGVERVHPFGLFAARVRDREAIKHTDALDHEHAILGLDLADCVDLVALRIDLDLTRFQRAGERAGESPASRGDDVVERGRVGRIAVGIHAVVLGDLGMHAEHDRFCLRGQMREPLRSAKPFDPHAGDIGNLAHRMHSTRDRTHRTLKPN